MLDSASTAVGTVVSLWRYPVKSMMGEELNATEVTDRGLLGDRSARGQLRRQGCQRQESEEVAWIVRFSRCVRRRRARRRGDAAGSDHHA